MPLVEIARLPNQVAKLGAFEAARRPIDFRNRTGPRFSGEDWREGLAEWPVEAGVVRDDEIRRLD